MPKISEPIAMFFDTDGSPLENGRVYIGELGLDAKANPVQVYSDEALNVTVAQPIRTLGGRPVVLGTTIDLYIAEIGFSITTETKDGSPVITNLDVPTGDLETALASTDADKGVTLVAGAGKTVADRTELKALASDGDRTRPINLLEAGREGVFVFDSADYSTEVTGDTLEAVYVAPDSDPTGASGAWVRHYEGLPFIGWFGVVPDTGVDLTTTFDAVVASGSPGAGGFQLGIGTYVLGDWTPPSGCRIVGWGDSFYESNNSTKANTVIQREPLATYALELDDTSYCLFQYIDFDGNGGKASGTQSPVGNSGVGAFPFQMTFTKCKFYDGYAGVDGDGAQVPGGFR